MLEVFSAPATVPRSRCLENQQPRAHTFGLRYRVVSLTDADFAEDSLLHLLTEKQRKILMTAYALGYFDVPKKVNSDELGARLHLSGSTVVEHLNKAERRLLERIIGEA